MRFKSFASFRRFRKRRLQLRRSKRETDIQQNAIFAKSENLNGVAQLDGTDYTESVDSGLSCPTAKYFVHPRVAFSVRGKTKYIE